MEFHVNWQSEARKYWGLCCEVQEIVPQPDNFLMEVALFGPTDVIDTWKRATGHFVALHTRWGNGCFHGAAIKDLFCYEDSWFCEYPQLLLDSLLSLPDGKDFLMSGCYELIEMGDSDGFLQLVERIGAGRRLQGNPSQESKGPNGGQFQHRHRKEGFSLQLTQSV